VAVQDRLIVLQPNAWVGVPRPGAQAAGARGAAVADLELPGARG
jgi:hypothetical protein